MENKALVVIDLQNDITKNYREIIDNVNRAIAWANSSGMHVVYIQLNNLSAGTGYTVRILSDCITSYDKKKLDEMLAYYQSKGCLVEAIADMIR